jgi:hypothetical protein
MKKDVLTQPFAPEHHGDPSRRSEQQPASMAPDVQERVGPSEEVARATQALAGLRTCPVLAGVVHDHDCDIECTLHLAQVTE